MTIAAAGCAALSNLFFRNSSVRSSATSSPNSYLVCFYFFSFLASLILSPSIWQVKPDFATIAIGGIVGVLNVSLMLLTSQALKKGPSGLTFAFQNASAVFPGALLFVIFGTKFGFSCSFIQVIGMGLVLFGLFLGAKKESKKESVGANAASTTWLKYAIACLAVQVMALTLIQGRCVLFESDKLGSFLSTFAVSEDSDGWFMPGQFGVAFCLQLFLFLREKQGIKKHEAVYGFLGGLANFGSTCLLLFATKYALPAEKGILFPCFAVTTIVLCNLWANRLYKEEFNFLANAVCAIGIFVGVLG